MQIEAGGPFSHAAAKFRDRIATQSSEGSLSYEQLRLAVRVLGQADEKWGSTLAAELVLKEGAIREETLARIGETLKTRLAKYKIPRRYRVLDALSE